MAGPSEDSAAVRSREQVIWEPVQLPCILWGNAQVLPKSVVIQVQVVLLWLVSDWM